MKGHNMTEIEELEKQIIAKIGKVRPKSLKKLLGLYLKIMTFKADYYDGNKVNTAKLREHMKFMSHEYVVPKMRVVRDYKHALEVLIMCDTLLCKLVDNQMAKGKEIIDELAHEEFMKEMAIKDRLETEEYIKKLEKQQEENGQDMTEKGGD